MSSHHEEAHEPMAWSTYFLVWIALLVLTVVTVGASYLDLKHMVVFTALAIATVKASLVLLYFMHLRHEKMIFFNMILAILITYGVFIALTFTDYITR